MNRIIIIVLLFSATYFSVCAQQQDAKSLHETAKTFMRQGDYANAVVVLNHAIQQDPGNLEILKDLAFTYYLQKDYSKAIATAKPLPERADADVQSYQVLGMIYKAIEERKDCEKMYKQGIKKFPKSGVLYNEYAEVLGTKDGNEAIRLWEKGIEIDPNYAGNYFNACKYYYVKNEKTWSLIYGEIFVNLESYSKRTTEIKDLVEDGYKQLFANVDAQKKLDTKNAFVEAYLTALNNQAAAITQGITPESLSVLRTRFITEWFDKNAGQFPFRLFEYHRQLIKEGMFDAYNQWLFGAAQNMQTFQTWTTAHADEYNKFINFQKGRIFKLPAGQYYQSR
jgi:tetratricopeptide (TPR) repeat protein